MVLLSVGASCCCVALKSHRFIGVPFYRHSGLMPEFSAECTACGKCVKACMFEALGHREKDTPTLNTTVAWAAALAGPCALRCNTGVRSLCCVSRVVLSR